MTDRFKIVSNKEAAIRKWRWIARFTNKGYIKLSYGKFTVKTIHKICLVETNKCYRCHTQPYWTILEVNTFNMGTRSELVGKAHRIIISNKIAYIHENKSNI